jgi:hypothetical protein
MGNKDGVDWWGKCVTDRCFLLPDSIDHGPTKYTIHTECVTDPDGSVHSEVTEIVKREDRGMPGETYPGGCFWMPEFACRPALGIPSRDMDVVLDPSPKEGPAGTILLHNRYIGRKRPPVKSWDGKLLAQTNQWLYWLDPARDYVVVRHDMIATDESGKEEVHSTIIDDMAKSPQGTWYATRIRRKGSIRDHDGKVCDEIIDLYVDFNVNLPDSLFEPPAPGRIH